MKGIAQLAQQLGISTGTVSRALNGKPDVNAETRRRVLEAARSQGYAPNHAARALAQGATHQVGFMIQLAPENASSNDYFFMGVFDAMQRVLDKHELDLLVLPCPSHQDHYTYLQRFVSRSAVDGMILASTMRTDPRITLMQSSGIPFVTLGRSSTGSGYSWIDLDFETAVETAIDRFVARGHRRIALTLPDGAINFGSVVHQSYRQALARHGLEYDEQLVLTTHRREDDGDGVVDRLLALSAPPTAIFLMYELTAIGIYRRLRERGLEPGRDLAIISFRDEPTIRFIEPSLTCFHISLDDVGIALAHALLAQIPQFSKAYPGGIIGKRPPVTLVAGRSDACDPPA